MSTTTTPPETTKPPRKFPTPCWTQDEALALIEAYRERWYALRRGYLRTADWDAVAAAVAARCPASPAKTSAQCRHKMEKLRQRYRAEKQRSLSFPGRFFSSWFFFENMDAMENGSSSVVGSDQAAANRSESAGGIRIKGLGDRGVTQSVFGAKNSKNSDGNTDQALSDPNLVTLAFQGKNSSPNFGSRILNGHLVHLDDGSDGDAGDATDFGGEFGVSSAMDGRVVASVFRHKKLGKLHGNFGADFDSNHDDVDGINDDSALCARTPVDPYMVPPGFRQKKKFSKFDGMMNPNYEFADEGFCVNMSGERYLMPAGFRAKVSGKSGGNSSPNFDSRFSNGFSPASGMGRKSASNGGVKRDRGTIADIVSSIKLLAEGFIKMEKMKMEMAREIEKMRMEMEMKRNELILESQRQIVDAFVTVLLENKKKKASKAASPES
ncbi:hypothetical protein NMG60_11027441 [Bertholletia excelsa]